MSRTHSLLGIASILLSIPFYIIVRLMNTTDRLDKFYQQHFLFAFPAIFLLLPALTIGLAVMALRQKNRNKLFAYLAGIVSIPVFILAGFRTMITFAYIILAVSSR
jgi:uncharacterized SAM-binding protein YcdF (DUF218 family)